VIVHYGRLKYGVNRVIQSCSAVLNEVVGEIILSENIKKVFTDLPLFLSYDAFMLVLILLL
jgi:hypothetical protein